MGITTTPTKLALAEWARLLGIHPLHVQGVDFTPGSRSAPSCKSIWAQYDWQTADRVSREQVMEAIRQAEQMLEASLGFPLAPEWVTDEWRTAARPYQRELVNYTGLSMPDSHSSIQTKKGWVITGGVEGKTVVQLARAITWSDTDTDGYKETGTVTATVTLGQAPCEIELYYPGKGGDPGYRIRPVHVSIPSGGTTATITFRRELAVKESILEAMDYGPADPLDDSDFLTTVDVYRHYNDPSQQATLMWEPRGCASCSGGGCSNCSYSVQAACLLSRGDPKIGVLAWSPGVWNPTTFDFDPLQLALGRSPDLIRLWYYAGWRAAAGCPTVMDQRWASAVAHLSLSLIDRPICDCSANEWAFWREDFAATRGAEGETYYQITQRDLENPFGTRRGAIDAWRRVNDRGVALVRPAVLL